MPVMSGDEVLPHLLTMKPDVRVIVSSGQDEKECMRKLREPRVAGFLAKPYTPASLAAKVHAVLNGDDIWAAAGDMITGAFRDASGPRKG